jgi:predicted dehydrogenase
MTPRHHVGLVGCGNWGRLILRDLVALGCEVTVASPSDESRQRALEEGAIATVADAAALPDVAGIVVATPTITHADVLEVLLPRDVPMFCEKPLAPDPVRAWDLARRAADRLFVMDKWRYHPGVEELARIARSRELGPVVGLRTTRAQMGCPHDDVDTAWILAPHDLSIGLEILGSLPGRRRLGR